MASKSTFLLNEAKKGPMQTGGKRLRPKSFSWGSGLGKRARRGLKTFEDIDTASIEYSKVNVYILYSSKLRLGSKR
jgi:hypothetical protein